jgi:two-component system OmpR family response regulator
MKILLVEDEEKLAHTLKRGLELSGYAVDIIEDGRKALTRISLHRNDYDVVILDLMLPSLGGEEVCKQMRAQNIEVPVLILTARAEVQTKVNLLMTGADDYLVKPFSYAELLARLQALLRRPSQSVPEILRAGDIALDPGTRRATRGDRDLNLTLKEFGLLEYFMRHAGQALNREDLLTHLWDFNYEGFSNVVDVHVKNLRRKLDAQDPESVLQTVRGIGYKFIA